MAGGKKDRGAGNRADDGLISKADHVEAAVLARQAGRILMSLREGLGARLSADQARHEGDSRSHEFLSAAIKERHPGDGFLSEEGADGTERLDRGRVWVVDPLDGTREFSEVGRTDWAVHVALCLGGQPVVGAVALPAEDVVFGTGGLPPTASRPPGPVRLVVSRTRPPAFVGQLAALLDAELVPMGSAGAKAMAVVRGRADVYLHSGGQYEWDSAAPVAVALAAGLHASRLDGSRLVYNQPNPWLPDLLMCRRDLAGLVFAALAQVRLGPERPQAPGPWARTGHGGAFSEAGRRASEPAPHQCR